MLAYGKSQSLWNRAGLSTLKSRLIRVKMTFQSLWRRAESFDIKLAVKEMFRTNVLIPLEQGRVFRPFETNSSSCHSLFQSLWNRAGSFDIIEDVAIAMEELVSIPLEQGGVFRLRDNYW